MKPVLAFALLTLGCVSQASASISISSFCNTLNNNTCTITSGTRSASAQFVQSGNNLVVTLTNATTSKAVKQDDILTAIFFQVTGPNGVLPTLGRVSATLASGSSVLFAPVGGTGPNMGPEWAYRGGLSGAPGAGTYGISSASYQGDFVGTDRFDQTKNYQGPVVPDGLQYGIVGAGGVDTVNGSPLVTGLNALIKNSVVFNLSGLSTNSAYSISKIAFQYGITYSDPCLGCGLRPNVPEPSQLLISGLVGLGIIGAALRRKLLA